MQGDTRRIVERAFAIAWERQSRASNHVRASFQRVGSSTKTLVISQIVAGAVTTIATGAFPSAINSTLTWWRIRMNVYSNGWVHAEIRNHFTDALLVTAQGPSSALATGGTLATGKPGIWDRNTGTNVFLRFYDDFRVAANPPLDAVLYPNQSIELRTEGIFREDTGGTSYAKVGSNVGCLPRLPPSGLENRKVEMYLKWSRGDFDQYPDTGIDDGSAQVHYRPS